jgi:prolyl 4-hydroxylase
MTQRVVETILEAYDAVLLDEDIKLVYINDFLSDIECEHIVGLSYDLLYRASETTDGTTAAKSEWRTSHTACIPKSNDDVIRGIEERVARLVSKPVSKLEMFQVVKYESGQFFKPHCDAFPDEYMKLVGYGQRQYTFFVYLNNVDAGGQTDFPTLGLSFDPKKRNALFWENCKDPKTCNPRTLHQGKPPIGDVKYGLNIWMTF